MAKLNFSLDGKLLGEFTLDKERITIGRRPTNDIHIDNLAVSGEHAMILTLGKDSFLEDLNSTNGTMVNQKLIKKHVLQHNDVIEFGKYQLKFLSDAPAQKTPNDGFEKTVLVNKPAAQANTPPQAAEAPQPVAEPAPIAAAPVPAPVVQPVTQVAPAPSAAGVAQIKMLDGENAGQEVLLNRAMVKLGTPGAQLAVITKRPNGYFISHVEGDKRPLLNGQSIGMQAHMLKHQDKIEVAGVEMEFHFAWFTSSIVPNQMSLV